MRALTTTELLELWDEALPQAPVAQALLMLSKGLPQTPPSQLAQLSIGARDRLLLDLRELTFGPRLPAVLRCPACAVTLEVSFTADDIRVGDGHANPASFELCVEDRAIAVRLPTSLDVAALAGCADVDEGERLLLDRCVRMAPGDDSSDDAELTPAERDAIDRAMAEADPQADVHLSATCPECGHEWLATFDIAAFFWKEIRASVAQLMLDVDTLASSYGWSEGEILGMSPWRRQRYMAMAQG